MRRYPNEEWLGLYRNENITVDIIYPNPPHYETMDHETITRVSIHDWRYMIYHKCDRNTISSCKDISIQYMNIIDRIGMNVSKWKYDIDIICII